jgi:hypothetical protein
LVSSPARSPGRIDDLHVHLARHDLRERRLAEARRAVEQRVVEGIAALLGRLDEDPEPLLDLVLADEVGPRLRPQRGVELGVALAKRGGNKPFRHGAGPA